jgi:gliding motility-associated-like protein
MNTNPIFLQYIKYLLLFIAPTLSISQPNLDWNFTYGGDSWEELQTTITTKDGGYLLGGFTNSNNSKDITEPNYGSNPQGDIWILKVDKNGKKLWDKRYGGTGNEQLWAVIQNDQGYILVGGSNSIISGNKTGANYGGYDYWIIQIKPDGQIVWQKTYGGDGDDIAYSISEIENTNQYIIGGHSNSSKNSIKSENAIAGSTDYWVIKIDNKGEILWEKTYGGEGADDYPLANQITKNQTVLIGGGSVSKPSGSKTADFKGVKDFWLLNIDYNTGALIWDKSYGGNNEDVLVEVKASLDGNSFFVGGQTRSAKDGKDKLSESYGNLDYFLVKIDDKGNKIWDKTYGGSGLDVMYSLNLNATGYFTIGGVSASDSSGVKTKNSKGGNDFWLLYLDTEGNIVWDKSIGGSGDDALTSIIPAVDNDGYILCGHSASNMSGDKTEDSKGLNDFWIAKVSCFLGVSLGKDTIVCKNIDYTLDAALQNCPNCLYKWDDNSTSAKRIVNPISDTSYSVKVVAYNGCETSSKIKFNVKNSPTKVDFVTLDPSCADGKDGRILLDSIVGGKEPYTFIVHGDTIRSTKMHNLVSGNYKIKVMDGNNCFITKEVVLENPEPFNLGIITSDNSVTYGTSIFLTTTTNQVIDTFFWNDRTMKTLDGMVKPEQSTKYILTAYNKQGCIATAFVDINIKKDLRYYAANVFTPNDDNINDKFTIIGNNLVESITNLQIFDRWGSIVYFNNEVYPNLTDNGWDGDFNGSKAPSGAYIYIAHIKYIDGSAKEISGDITLVR